MSLEAALLTRRRQVRRLLQLRDQGTRQLVQAAPLMRMQAQGHMQVSPFVPNQPCLATFKLCRL